jgi:hypothetical protein
MHCSIEPFGSAENKGPLRILTPDLSNTLYLHPSLSRFTVGGLTHSSR